MYLLIKLNPNALPGSQDARHQCSLKIIQLTILRLMTCLPPPPQNCLAFLTKAYPPSSIEQPWKSKHKSGRDSRVLIKWLNLHTPNDTDGNHHLPPTSIFLSWFTTLTHTTVLPTKWWHSSSVPGLAPIHVIAERFVPESAELIILSQTQLDTGHQDLLPSKFPFQVDPHGGIPYIGPLPYHQSLFSGLDLMILLYRKHTRGGGLPRWLSGRVCLQCRRLTFDPRVRKFPWNGYPLQYSSLENLMDRGA